MERQRQQDEKVTIQVVAERAGVSAMTVSNVYNNSGRVGAATRARVLAAIKDLGYVPNLVARRLVGSAPARLGLICSDAESVFLNSAVATISMAAAEMGLQLLIQSPKETSIKVASSVARSLIRSGAEALILIPPFAEILSGSAEFKRLGVPAAAIATAGPLPDMATVRIDNCAAAKAITELLIASGRRRIGVVVGPKSCWDSIARLEGYQAALQAHNIPLSAKLCVEGEYTFSSGLVAAEKLLSISPRPDAIMAANDDMAAAVLWAAHRRGLKLPRDLAVTGFDDTLLATRVWPALTTVRQPIREMVDTAISVLTNTLRHSNAHARPEEVVVDFTIVERESTSSSGSVRSSGSR